jgi:hypothetical protein
MRYRTVLISRCLQLETFLAVAILSCVVRFVRAIDHLTLTGKGSRHPFEDHDSGQLTL